MDFIWVLIGLALLLGGGEVLVRGGVALAVRARLPMAVVGAVVLGFGTSMPELLTSLSAAWAGSPGIAVGNVLGSNIANILLILGVAAVIAPVPAAAAGREERVWLALITVMGVLLLSVQAELGRGEGLVLLAALAVYLWRAIRSGRAAEQVDAGLAAPLVASRGRIAALILFGIATLIAGAWMLVEGATGLARAFGITETVIGLSVVAIGTSLPELAASTIAAWRGQAGMALGNVLGSNIFNVLAILGLTATTIPIPVPVMLSPVDLAVFAGAAALLLLMLALSRDDMGRGGGVLFLGLYAAYVGWLALQPA